MTPALLVLLSLLHLVDPPPAEVARIEAFAASVTRAVDAAPALPFTGPAAREGAIAALLIIAHHESNFDPRVIDCRVRGDRNRSATAFQLMTGFGRMGHTEAALCASNELAASAALAVLVYHARRCSRSAPLAYFYAYAAGGCTVKSKAGGDMCWAWQRAATRLGIVGAACDRKGPLTWSVASNIPKPTQP